jgi:hypothetical protein
MKVKKIIGISVITLLGLVPFLEAGKIGPLDQGSLSHSSGFGGWNLTNVNVKITDLDYNEIATKSFDPSTGSYTTMVEGDTFESDIHETTTGNEATIRAHLHGKDWPVGEPSGIKVMESDNHDDVLSHSKPASCIMTTSFLEGAYLDSTTPSETLCDSDFQTHKRFKLNLLPSTYISDGAYGEGVNLTFNVADDANTWRYMVLQKINNYTNKRMDGYKLEIGFLDGSGVFTAASVNSADIKLSIGTDEDMKNGLPSDIWASDELATFSHGLFGSIDEHFTTNGFFYDQTAGYNISLNANEDTIESASTLGSNYTTLFGNWVPDIWAPKGIFWDDDNNPETDAEVMAFWADYDGDNTYAWTKGNEDNFAVATALELATWASSPVHEVDVIEDVLNLGLSYIVEIGDTTTFPATANNTFTIRITPHFAAAIEQVAPGYVSNSPSPLSNYVSERGTLSITPESSFTIGNTLTLVVSDKGLDTSTSVDTVDINVTTSLGESETITLTEIGGQRGVFTAQLPTIVGTTAGSNSDGSVTVSEGTAVTATYNDADVDGTIGGTAIVTATTTAAITESGGSSGDVNDNISLLFTIFGFLLIGGLIVRRKLA